MFLGLFQKLRKSIFTRARYTYTKFFMLRKLSVWIKNSFFKIPEKSLETLTSKYVFLLKLAPLVAVSDDQDKSVLD